MGTLTLVVNTAVQLRNPRRGVHTRRARCFNTVRRCSPHLRFSLPRARVAVRAVALRLPGGQPLQSARSLSACQAGSRCSPRSCVSLPCGQPLQSAQLCFRLPCGQPCSPRLLGCHADSRCSPRSCISACREGRGCSPHLRQLASGQGLRSLQLCFSLTWTPLHTHLGLLMPSSRKSPALLSRHLEPMLRGVDASEEKVPRFRHACTTRSSEYAKRSSDNDSRQSPWRSARTRRTTETRRCGRARPRAYTSRAHRRCVRRPRATAACLAPVVPSHRSRGSPSAAAPAGLHHHPRNAKPTRPQTKVVLFLRLAPTREPRGRRETVSVRRGVLGASPLERHPRQARRDSRSPRDAASRRAGRWRRSARSRTRRTRTRNTRTRRRLCSSRSARSRAPRRTPRRRRRMATSLLCVGEASPTFVAPPARSIARDVDDGRLACSRRA